MTNRWCSFAIGKRLSLPKYSLEPEPCGLAAVQRPDSPPSSRQGFRRNAEIVPIFARRHARILGAPVDELLFAVEANSAKPRAAIGSSTIGGGLLYSVAVRQQMRQLGDVGRYPPRRDVCLWLPQRNR